MNLSRFSRQLKAVGLVISVGTLLSGCMSTGVNSEQIAKDRLELARSAYSQAKADPDVEAYAMKSLLDAEKTLQEAEELNKKAALPTDTYSGAASDKKPLYDNVSRLAYMAEMKAKTSVALAEGVVARNEIVKLGKEKAEIQLQKSQREKKLLQQDLDAKAAALEHARQQLSTATSEAERARYLADIQAMEAALAKIQADAKAQEAEKAQAELAKLLKDLSELQGQLTERGIVLTIGDVLFATGKSDLNVSAELSMDKIADFLQENQNRNLLVEGHTDSVGNDEYNQGLSEQRAAAVKSALVKRGIASERIVTIGYGKKYPLLSNEAAAGKQQNRRVEAIILNEGVTPASQFRK